MKHVALLVAAALFLSSAASAAPLTPEQRQIIQNAAIDFLDSTPKNNFLIPPEEVNKRIQAKTSDFILVDVRSEREFDKGHLPGAINIPYREIAETESLELLPPDKEIILYCNSGHESTKVLSILRMLGYNCYGMKWGMMGWSVVPSTAAALKAIAAGTTGEYPLEPLPAPAIKH